MSDFIDLVSADAVPDHPATFTASIVDVFLKELLVEQERFDHRLRVLDSMAGRGGIHELDPWFDTVGVELEEEWARAHPHTEQGDATNLRFADASFDAYASSYPYGNRMADGYAGDGTTRHTYRIYLGRALSENSGAGLQWGDTYRSLHTRALHEAQRVVVPGGLVLLNMSDHIRDLEVQPVVQWYVDTMNEIGLTVEREIPVPTPRNRNGANAELRVEHEVVIVARRG